MDTLAVSSVMKWTVSIMDHLNSTTDCHNFMGKCVCLAWQLWKSRNDWVLNANPVDPHVAGDKASFIWREFQDSKIGQGTQEQDDDQVSESLRWTPLLTGEVKINCYTAI